MRRSEVIQKITKILKKWEDSELNDKTSKEVLDMLEDECGILPPFDTKLYEQTWRNDGTGHEWEKE